MKNEPANAVMTPSVDQKATFGCNVSSSSGAEPKGLAAATEQQQQQQQQQQPLVSKLRLKPGKNLAAAAALQARQSGALAANIAQLRRKPLNLAAARQPSAAAAGKSSTISGNVFINHVARS